MRIQRLFLVSVLVGLSLRILNVDWSVRLPEALVVGSSIMLLFICELSGSQRRLVAVEKILQRRAHELSRGMAHQPDSRKDIPSGSTAEILRDHLDCVVGERHPRTSRQHHDHVRDLIAQHLKQHGWDVHLEEFDGVFGPAHNVVAEKRGTDPDAGIIIVGAHYDTVEGTPGADDNGIAVAGVMRLGELLAHSRFRKTVRLVAWDLEEQQSFSCGLMGSKHMAMNVARRKENIEAVICLEMIGVCSCQPYSQTVMPGLRWVAPQLWKHLQKNCFRGDFIAAIGNSSASQLTAHFLRSAELEGLPASGISVSGFLRLFRDLRRSDHAPFWDRGIPAIMLTDTSNFRSQYYHTALDLPETIDFEFAAKVIEATAKVIVKQAVQTESLPAVTPERKLEQLKEVCAG